MLCALSHTLPWNIFPPFDFYQGLSYTLFVFPRDQQAICVYKTERTMFHLAEATNFVLVLVVTFH